MPFRVGQYVTIDKGPGEWHGQIIARLPLGIFMVRLGGTSGSSMITSQVEGIRISPILLPRQTGSAIPIVRRVILGMLLEDTALNQSNSILVRKDIIAKALHNFKKIVDRDSPISDNQHSIRGIFLAPEYMFANPQVEKGFKIHRHGDVRQLEEAEVTGLCNYFKELSAGLSNVLIIPGTIAWRRNIAVANLAVNRERYRQRLMDSMQFFPVRHGHVIPSNPSHRYVTPYIPPTINNSGSDTDDDCLIDESRTATRVPQTYGQKIDSMLTATYIARNTAFVFYNGTIIAKYHKIGDFHEVLGVTNTVHIPSVQPCRFDCGGMIFGMSICADDELRKDTPGDSRVQIQQTQTAVDFHIKLSASCSPHARYAKLLSTGYLLSCDSDIGYCLVLNAAGDKIDPLPSDKVGDPKLQVHYV